MTIGETLAVFGGIPLAVYLIVTAWAFAANARSAPRYRPGRPFVFTPVWYLAESSSDEAERAALPLSSTGPSGSTGAGTPVVPLEPGGARGTW